MHERARGLTKQLPTVSDPEHLGALTYRVIEEPVDRRYGLACAGRHHDDANRPIAFSVVRRPQGLDHALLVRVWLDGGSRAGGHDVERPKFGRHPSLGDSAPCQEQRLQQRLAHRFGLPAAVRRVDDAGDGAELRSPGWDRLAGGARYRSAAKRGVHVVERRFVVAEPLLAATHRTSQGRKNSASGTPTRSCRTFKA